MIFNHSSNFINGYMNDTKNKELIDMIDGPITKSYKIIQGGYYW